MTELCASQRETFVRLCEGCGYAEAAALAFPIGMVMSRIRLRSTRAREAAMGALCGKSMIDDGGDLVAPIADRSIANASMLVARVFSKPLNIAGINCESEICGVSPQPDVHFVNG